MEPRTNPPAEAAPPAKASRAEPSIADLRGGVVRRTDSRSLFAGAAELVIEHRGEQYRLRQTALGKLILTK